MAKRKRKTKQKPQIQEFKLAEIIPAHYNPRTITEDALAGLTKSLEKFGCVEPIIINKRDGKNIIVGGHQRLKALRKLKHKTVLCVTVELSEKEEKALNVTLNNPTIQGDFIKQMASYLDDLRLEIGKKDFVDLRLEKLRLDIESQRFEFRPGEKAPTPTKGGAKFWLNKTDITRFRKYKTFILDFSGGKDSSLALAWMARHFKDRECYAVFSDPGVEFPGMSDHVAQVAAYFQIKCVILKPKTDWWVWLRKEGQWPSLIYRKCQQEFIFKVTKSFRKKFPIETTLLLDGSRATQATRGSKKGLDTPVGSLPKYDAFHPCFCLTKDESENLLKQLKVPLWPGYSQGFVRTACWCCPGQCGLQACALQKNYPGLADCIRWWEKRIGPMQPLRDRYFDQVVKAGERQLAQADKKKKPAHKKRRSVKKK